ncbi:phage portal protein [Azospirillum sp.]|uniref:phage portal protein n=1 Tax=Azospirillum sp. TaxID=34012 RepID=UPI002D2F3756|nr:phage portal protein [Azospirillum sp.]HYD66176.1 phage portal protein [Azospirillum sp.]
MRLLDRILTGLRLKAVPAEGEYRPGPYLLDGGWLSATAGKFMNWWQKGYSLDYGQSGAMVEACVSAYSQTVAMCPGDHWRSTGDGGRERVTSSALSRIIRRPNDYQSMSDLLLNMTRRLYSKGEAFAYAGVRNDRSEIAELHWMREGQPLLGAGGEIFYALYGNEIAEKRFDLSRPIPARDVLHIRLHTPRHPLKGESPILATALEMMFSGAALNQQITYYLNQSRPSFMLETDQQLTAQQTQDLRQRWIDQTTGENAGSTTVLAWGLKAKPATQAVGDTMLADMLKMSDQNVALAFRMPLQILGIGGTPFASTEALMSSWRAMGLGFALNHIEEAFGLLFRLKGFPEEYVEFDTNALLRSSFKEMLDALSNGTRRVMAVNEARRYLDLPAKAGGDEILVQQQDIPLSMAGKVSAPAAKPPAGDTEDPEQDKPEADADGNERARQLFRSAHARHAA